ncbi:MAG TPA: hypothetical protein VK013_02490 [Myxococcaceae bacterium]|nr:hypothetical protein [Myxococcaceae bacterium]
MNTSSSFFVVLGACVVLSLGCQRSSGPSPEYQAAFERYLALRSAQQEKAFLDPEMERILAQLSEVDPRSTDAEAARTLADDIRQGQARAQAHQEELRRLGQAGRTPIVVQGAPAEEEEEEAPAGENPVAAVPEPTYGMTVAQLREQFSRCFEPGEAIHVPGKGLRDIWVLKNLGVCRELHPRYTQQVVLLEEGKVWGTATLGERIVFPQDGGTPERSGTPAPTGTPDGGPPAGGADGSGTPERR